MRDCTWVRQAVFGLQKSKQVASAWTEEAEADNPAARGITGASGAQAMDSGGRGRKEMHDRKRKGEFQEGTIFNRGSRV